LSIIISFYLSLDSATLFSQVDTNKLRNYVKNQIGLICAKFGADLTYTSKVTSRETKSLWPTLYTLQIRDSNQ